MVTMQSLSIKTPFSAAESATAARSPAGLAPRGTVTGSIKLSSHADVLTVSGGAINGNIVGSGSSDTVTFTLGAGNTFTYSSTVSGVNAVSVNTGTVLLEGTLNSSNLAIDGAGTLEVGTGGNIVPSVTDDGALEFGQIGSYTYGGAISGSGMVEQLGAGTTVLTAANNYTGGTAVDAGTLQMSGSGTLGGTSGTLSVGGGTLDLGGTTQTTGALTLSAGTIQDGTLDSSAFGVQVGTVSAALDGSGALTKTGTGTVTLSGVNTYGGGTDLAAGTLELGSGGSIAGNVTFTSGSATLQFDTAVSQLGGDIAGAVTGDSIDLRFQSFASGDKAVWQQNGSTGTLTLETSGGSTLQTLVLMGSYASADFTVAADGHGDTSIDLVTPPNPPPPVGTTADMIMNNPSNGDYEIYDIGGNAIMAAYSLGQIEFPLEFVGLGDFSSTDTSDILLRNSSTGAFQADYISGNTITNTVQVGTVGLNWNFAGTGDFDGGSSLSELLLRNSASGSFELYQVAGGGVLSGSSVAAVGNNLQVSGFGNFSGSSTTQMIMEQANEAPGTNAYWLYTYNPSAAAFAGHVGGTVGNNLSVVGFGDLLGNGETQMVMQQNNGNFWLYTYQPSTNSLSGTLVGAIGSNFHVVGFGPARHFGPGRDADAGCRRGFRGLPVQRQPQCLRR